MLKSFDYFILTKTIINLILGFLKVNKNEGDCHVKKYIHHINCLCFFKHTYIYAHDEI